MNLSTNYTDHTQVEVGGKYFTMIGTPIEWVAYIKAGHTVNSAIRPVKGNPPSYFLTMLVPEIPRYVAMVRDEMLEDGTTEQELLDYVRYHAEFFQSRRQLADH